MGSDCMILVAILALLNRHITPLPFQLYSSSTSLIAPAVTNRMRCYGPDKISSFFLPTRLTTSLKLISAHPLHGRSLNMVGFPPAVDPWPELNFSFGIKDSRYQILPPCVSSFVSFHSFNGKSNQDVHLHVEITGEVFTAAGPGNMRKNGARE